MLNWLWKWLGLISDPDRTSIQADDPDGVLFTRPATWEDVLHTARLLNAHRVRYLLVGGYALAAHGLVRMTQDVDIAVAPDSDNARRWIAALAQLPDAIAAEMRAETDPFEGDYLHAIRINDEFTVDVLPSVAGVAFDVLEQYATTVTIDGEAIRVLNLEGLLLTKQGVRLKDQADAEWLRQVIATRDNSGNGQR
jgi:hypothetical protein